MISRRRVAVDVVPAAALAHEAAGFVQAVAAPVGAVSGDELDDGVRLVLLRVPLPSRAPASARARRRAFGAGIRDARSRAGNREAQYVGAVARTHQGFGRCCSLAEITARSSNA